MKVITLTAPYSWLVAAKLKRYETRSWTTKYRGLLGIHTGQGLGPVGGAKGLIELCARPYFCEAMIALGIDDPLAVPRGLIVCVCNLVDVATTDAVEHLIDPAERAFGDYSPARYAWQLDGVAVLGHPIVAKGSLGLWNWGEPVPSLLTPAVVPATLDTTRPPTGRRPRSFA